MGLLVLYFLIDESDEATEEVLLMNNVHGYLPLLHASVVAMVSVPFVPKISRIPTAKCM